MDGGVSGTGTHLDLIVGAGRAVVLSLTDGSGDEADDDHAGGRGQSRVRLATRFR